LFTSAFLSKFSGIALFQADLHTCRMFLINSRPLKSFNWCKGYFYLAGSAISGPGFYFKVK